MDEILAVVMNLSLLVFVIASELAMGLSLTPKSIIIPGLKCQKGVSMW